MAKSFKPLCSLFVLVLVICSNMVLFVSEARPLKFGNSWSLSSIKSGSLFDIDELYTEAMKTSGGPSPGRKGHSFTTSQTLEGIKNEGPSSGGKGHAFTTSQTLGGIKNGGPSSERKGENAVNRENSCGLREEISCLRITCLILSHPLMTRHVSSQLSSVNSVSQKKKINKPEVLSFCKRSMIFSPLQNRFSKLRKPCN